MVQRPPAGTIPDAPGAYEFLDADGRILYVGKARSLRQRLANYFADPATLPLRTAQMVAAADRVEWTVVANEGEALMLEYNLIQLHHPRFNIRLKDDKSYPWLAVTVDEQWPRPAVVRGVRRKGVRYFGPYPHVGAIRETLDLLLRWLPVRTCSDAKFRRHERLGRPCLLYHIERCSGPCVGAVDPEHYRRMVADLMAFLSGDSDALLGRLEAAMSEASDALEFERAAHLRDQLASVRKAAAGQQMVSERAEDLDVLGFADEELEAAVCVFHVRKGRVVGRNGFVVDKVEDLTPGRMTARVLEQFYAEPVAGVPRQVLVPCEPEERERLEAWLSGVRGGPVAIRVPKRGPKRALQETVALNAAEDLARHRLRRASDHNSRARALEALQLALGLPAAPLRIECYDMSHLQGTDYVGSMVVLEDGLPKRSDYRHFQVRDVPGNDDYAAMEEVLTRRLTALVEERRTRVGDRGAGAEGTPAGTGEEGRGPATPPTRRRFAYPPQLILLDGGKGQLAVGVRVLERFGLTGEIPIASLAKSFEEVFVPGSPEPVRIPRQSEALYVLQRARDEAHRFAVSYHRRLRTKRMTTGALDGVTGLGPARRARLLKEIGSMKALRAAPLEVLTALPWLPDDVAAAVHERLHEPIGPARRVSGSSVGA